MATERSGAFRIRSPPPINLGIAPEAGWGSSAGRAAAKGVEVSERLGSVAKESLLSEPEPNQPTRKVKIMNPEKNLQLMKTLDDSWNGQELTTFRKRHTKDCVVRWPNQPPTLGIDAHEQEAIAFFKMFPDQHLVNNPYKVMIAQGDWTCTIADFTGTMKGPMTMADGKIIPPTNKTFKVDFCTVANWNDNGEIVEENLFYDLMGMLKQIGVM